MPIICAYPPTTWRFLSAWLDSCLHGSGFKGALSYRRRADCDNSTFISRNDFSNNFHSVCMEWWESLHLFFFETSTLAGLRFLSCAANVQGTHRLPVTCSSFVFYCWKMNKLVQTGGCIGSLLFIYTQVQEKFMKGIPNLLLHFDRYYINSFLWM